ncbi:hypothetical protein JOL79_14735 [Microbispora sp. RL4-1S]|uniref:Uncharacterized protein n=1 Tax=Microbispora oryzae TaxID=2806554 RepID=A0A940WQG8_9ACTN|nr:hypothetical protein [Microbispora oryzae]MBP2705069.1 hypothetical protein [Microbispora oryzae]
MSRESSALSATGPVRLGAYPRAAQRPTAALPAPRHTAAGVAAGAVEG